MWKKTLLSVFFSVVTVFFLFVALGADQEDVNGPSVEVTQSYIQKQLENNFFIQDDEFNEWLIGRVAFGHNNGAMAVQVKDRALAFIVDISRLDKANISLTGGWILVYSPEHRIIQASLHGTSKTLQQVTIGKIAFVTPTGGDNDGNAAALYKALRHEAELFGSKDSGKDPFKN